MLRDFEHAEVMHAVAEDNVGMGEADAAECGGLAFVAGYVEERVGDDAVLRSDAGGEDALRRDAKFADAFFDHPVVGGGDGPYFNTGILQFVHESDHDGEEAGLNVIAEVLRGGVANGSFREAAVDLGHLAADGDLVDFAAVVAGVAVEEAFCGFRREQAGVDGMRHEAGAGVAGPEGAVEVEDGGARVACADGGQKLLSGKGFRSGGNGHAFHDGSFV